MQFEHGALVRFRTAPALSYVVVAVAHLEVDPHIMSETYYLRSRLHNGEAVEREASGHEIERADKITHYTCCDCLEVFEGDFKNVWCPPCQEERYAAEQQPSEPADTPTTITPAHATIRTEPADSLIDLPFDLESAPMPARQPAPASAYDREVCSALGSEAGAPLDYSMNPPALPDRDPTPPDEPLPLVWIDSASESETIPPTYQVDHGPNGWHAYFFEDIGSPVPDLESDGPFKTRDEAKHWCEQHHRGEPLDLATAVPPGHTVPEF